MLWNYWKKLMNNLFGWNINPQPGDSDDMYSGYDPNVIRTPNDETIASPVEYCENFDTFFDKHEKKTPGDFLEEDDDNDALVEEYYGECNDGELPKTLQDLQLYEACILQGIEDLTEDLEEGRIELDNVRRKITNAQQEIKALEDQWNNSK